MKSGWIINYKNGTSEIFTEERYKRTNILDYEIISEEHWFSIDDAKRKNPHLKLNE